MKFDALFVWITLAALVLYIGFTVTVTEWRTQFRKTMNELDSTAQSRAVDSLLNYETVKYFNNEEFEAKRYDASLDRYRKAAIKSQRTLSMLNTGQQALIAVSLVLMLWRATSGVVEGRMTLGDLVMVNAFMIQLYIPLNFLGVIYREIKQSLTDLDKMFVLMEKEREVRDAPGAQPLAGADATMRFEDVSFAYEAARPILKHVSFEIPGGQDGGGGRALGLGQVHARAAALPLLRRAAGPHHHRRRGHPQGHAVQRARARSASCRRTRCCSTTRSNTTSPTAAPARRARRSRRRRARARIHDFIAATPRATRPRWASAASSSRAARSSAWPSPRTLLKNPPIVIFDEATSALDSANERADPVPSSRAPRRSKTTLVIAHRLSTVVDAHEILVLECRRDRRARHPCRAAREAGPLRPDVGFAEERSGAAALARSFIPFATRSGSSDVSTKIPLLVLNSLSSAHQARIAEVYDVTYAFDRDRRARPRSPRAARIPRGADHRRDRHHARARSRPCPRVELICCLGAGYEGVPLEVDARARHRHRQRRRHQRRLRGRPCLRPADRAPCAGSARSTGCAAKACWREAHPAAAQRVGQEAGHPGPGHHRPEDRQARGGLRHGDRLSTTVRRARALPHALLRRPQVAGRAGPTCLMLAAPGGPATPHVVNAEVLDAIGSPGLPREHRPRQRGRHRGAGRGAARQAASRARRSTSTRASRSRPQQLIGARQRAADAARGGLVARGDAKLGGPFHRERPRGNSRRRGLMLTAG